MDAWLAPLAERLDLLSLFSLGWCSNAANRAAAAELRGRVRRGRFFARPLADGTCRWMSAAAFSRDRADATSSDSETESIRDYEVDVAPPEDEKSVYCVTKYDSRPPIALAWRDGALRVPDGADGIFHWSGEHTALHAESDEWNDRRQGPGSDPEYSGQKIRIYWVPAAEDGICANRDREWVLLMEARVGSRDSDRPGEYVEDSRGNALRYVILDENDGNEPADPFDDYFGARVVEFRLKIRFLVWFAVCDESRTLKSDDYKRCYRGSYERYIDRPTGAYEEYIEYLLEKLCK